MSVHVAMMAVAGPGCSLAMARNAHKSAFAGLVLSGTWPIYVEPNYDEELELALDPVADDLGRVLDAHPDVAAAMITTPSYYGTNADVPALAEACHSRGLALVTDDAWGLDYSLGGHPGLPEGALALRRTVETEIPELRVVGTEELCERPGVRGRLGPPPRSPGRPTRLGGHRFGSNPFGK
jgi:hypothetical protein